MSLSIPFRMPRNLLRCGAIAGSPEISAAYDGETVVQRLAYCMASAINGTP